MEQREREDHLDFLGLEDTKENLELLVSQELKEYKESLDGDYDRLKSKLMPANEPGFADPKVQTFWRRAKMANFTGRPRVNHAFCF